MSEKLETKIVVAMSGGVDSSLTACLLKCYGYDVIGVSMQVWDYRQHGGCESKITCCAPSDFMDARKVADKIGIPYYVFDFEDAFHKSVILPFVTAYKNGLTPNPCIECNRHVKFRELRNRAASLGYQKIATGHYSRIEERSDGFHLLRGLDRNKDQSYFLYALTQAELSDTLFPVGAMTKDEVRAMALEFGLPTASKPESQDICFIAGSVKDFVAKISGKSSGGKIVRKDGTFVGSHDGIEEFTVGQRKGIGVGGHHEPLYVTGIIPEENLIVVGHKEELEEEYFEVEGLSWLAPAFESAIIGNAEPTRAIAQLRSRHEGSLASVEILENSQNHSTLARVHFLENRVPVAPGQAAVFYDLNNEELLGGGTIARPRSFQN